MVVRHLKTGEQRVLLEGGTDARYVPTGHLVYAVTGALFAVPFDVERVEVTGSAVPVIEDLMTAFAYTGAAPFAFSDNGNLVYVSGSVRGQKNSLVWVDRGGAATPFGEPGRGYSRPRLSPDGQQLAVAVGGAEATDIWTFNLERDVMTRLTFEGGTRPLWMPDGSRIIYASNQRGDYDIFQTSVDGSGEVVQLTAGGFRIPASISPDGNVLLVRQDRANGMDIGMLRLDQEQNTEPTMLLDESFDERSAVFSPNGKWIAYTSDESGQPRYTCGPSPSFAEENRCPETAKPSRYGSETEQSFFSARTPK